jgi:hypothetical protein
MAKKAKKAKEGLKQKFEKAYGEMRGKAAKERQSRSKCPYGCKGDCQCGK